MRPDIWIEQTRVHNSSIQSSGRGSIEEAKSLFNYTDQTLREKTFRNLKSK